MADNNGVFELKCKDKDYLVIDVEGRGTHRVPLPNSLSIDELTGLWDAQNVDDDGTAVLLWSIKFFKEHLGEVVDDMTLDDFMGLSDAWQNASTPSLGESSA